MTGERVHEVVDRVFRIPLPTGFPVGDVNVYLVDGPEPVLIDTGVSGAPSLDVLAAALGAVGRRLEQIHTVLLTHVHVDHAGSSQAIRQAAGAQVFLHPRAHRRLVDVDRAHEAGLGWFRRFMVESGFSDEFVERYMAVSGMYLHYAESCPELRPVVDGDRFELDGRRYLTAVETFGHTSHHVGYVLEPERILFSGDHLLPHITSNPTLEAPAAPEEEKPRPLLLYRESLRRLLRSSFAVACPGHHRPFRDVAARCRELLEHQQRRCEQLLEVVVELGSATRKQLSLALFGKVPTWEVYLTLSEVQAAIEVLEADGRLRVRREQGLVRVAPAA
ncbi:MAG: MBL fold metallo-hydrolase [Deltaproteobacteria bacterium]|nr:MBL fold metallo-hydrolase [Deltaproteobacteria bacterium]MBW2530514.1 MBL fold metallo-hydrolase [Deltaproteobacteria bacterium]